MSVAIRRVADNIVFIDPCGKCDCAVEHWCGVDKRKSNGMYEEWRFSADFEDRVFLYRYDRAIYRPDLPDYSTWGKWSIQDGGWDADDLKLLGFKNEDFPPIPQDVLDEAVVKLSERLKFIPPAEYGK